MWVVRRQTLFYSVVSRGALVFNHVVHTMASDWTIHHGNDLENSCVTLKRFLHGYVLPGHT